MDSIKKLAECKACSVRFVLSSKNVKKGEYQTRTGETIWCTYYDCPKCGKRYYVQVDNVETNGMVIELTGMMARIVRARRKNKSIANKQAKYDKLVTDLADTRSKLAKMYNGTTITSACGVDIVLEVQHEADSM